MHEYFTIRTSFWLVEAGWSEDLGCAGGEVVVDEAHVGREDAHEQEEVPDWGHGACKSAGVRLVCETQPDGENEQQRSMHDVAEHDSEEEGERDDVKDSGIDLLVSWNSVCIHDFLEGPQEIIRLKQGWLGQTVNRVWTLLDVARIKIIILLDSVERALKVEETWAPN